MSHRASFKVQTREGLCSKATCQKSPCQEPHRAFLRPICTRAQARDCFCPHSSVWSQSVSVFLITLLIPTCPDSVCSNRCNSPPTSHNSTGKLGSSLDNHVGVLCVALISCLLFSAPFWLLVLSSPPAHWMSRFNLTSFVQLMALAKDIGLY